MAVRVRSHHVTLRDMANLRRWFAERFPAGGTLLRFVIAGTLGYLVYQAVLFLAYELALPLLPQPDAMPQVPFLMPDARLLAASLLAAEASIITVFCAHTWWTFRGRSTNGCWGLLRRLSAFHVKSAVSTFGILTVGVNVLSGHFGVDPYAAATLGTLLAFVWNWFWDSRVIWARTSPATPTVRGPLGLSTGRFTWGAARRAAPYALVPVLALLAAGLWGYVILQTVDRWDGESAERREDVVAYYAAGRLLRDGRGDSLYRADVLAETERIILGRPAGWHDGLVYMNPPFFAGLFAPLAALPYGQAQALWFGIGALAVFASVALLLPELRRLPRPWTVVFVLGALASFPVFWSLLYGQLSPLLLLSWVLFYRLLKDGREAPAGLVLAASLIKPHLALVPLLFLLTTGRWRALVGFGTGALALVAASVACVGPEATFVSYPRFLLESLSWQQEYGIDRAHMFGWASFFDLVLPGIPRLAGLLLAGAASVLTLVAAAFVWRRCRSDDGGPWGMLALAAATVVTSPHIHLQDLQILLVPAVLLVARPRDALALAVPALLFFLAPVTVLGVNLVTPALAFALAVVAARTAGARMPDLSPVRARAVALAGALARAIRAPRKHPLPEGRGAA